MAKIVDRIGNTIQEGSLLFWTNTNLIVKVKEIVPGGIQVGNNPANLSPGRIVLELPIPFQHQPGKDIVQFMEFLRTVDPAAETALAKVMEATNAR